MMVTFLNKTVFNSGCEGIVNTINCVGSMGNGLALEFALRYPEMEEQYKADCFAKKVKTGEILTYKTEDVLIINFPTKFHWKYPSQLKWIADGLDYMRNHYKEWNVKSIAIPPLGCSNGGLDFEKQIKPLIESKLNDLDIDIFVCIDPGYAEGKEKEMLDAFKLSDCEMLCNKLRINSKACAGLMNCNNITRFYMIRTINDVGAVTYKKLFDYFYNGGKPIKKESDQISLF
ncbi:MAG: macro domain-containing protein [Erysipelotrichales bacterium]|nr:macro domain-containing protein [Erysipelotrichales bacterium]